MDQKISKSAKIGSNVQLGSYTVIHDEDISMKNNHRKISYDESNESNESVDHVSDFCDMDDEVRLWLELDK